MSQSPCREWQGYRNHRGYGRRSGAPAKRFGTHRVHRQIWIMVNGPVPDGMEIMHICDNPACFRYDHLRLGTHAENMADMASKGRSNSPPAPRKLTDAQREQIRGLRGVVSQRALAREYGVHQRTIHRVMHEQIALDEFEEEPVGVGS